MMPTSVMPPCNDNAEAVIRKAAAEMYSSLSAMWKFFILSMVSSFTPANVGTDDESLPEAIDLEDTGSTTCFWLFTDSSSVSLDVHPGVNNKKN